MDRGQAVAPVGPSGMKERPPRWCLRGVRHPQGLRGPWSGPTRSSGRPGPPWRRASKDLHPPGGARQGGEAHTGRSPAGCHQDAGSEGQSAAPRALRSGRRSFVDRPHSGFPVRAGALSWKARERRTGTLGNHWPRSPAPPFPCSRRAGTDRSWSRSAARPASRRGSGGRPRRAANRRLAPGGRRRRLSRAGVGLGAEGEGHELVALAAAHRDHHELDPGGDS